MYAFFYDEAKHSKETDLLRNQFGKETLVAVYVEGSKRAYLFANNKIAFDPNKAQRIKIVLNYARLSGVDTYSESGLFELNFKENGFKRIES